VEFWVVSWHLKFDDPIALPNGRKKLATLDDARTYLTSQKLPNSREYKQLLATAIKTVMGAAEGTDFVMHARIAVSRYVHRNDPPEPFDTARKSTNWGKRKLKRDE
jgi:hypothetical protein